jgi:hypothetical protein
MWKATLLKTLGPRHLREVGFGSVAWVPVTIGTVETGPRQWEQSGGSGSGSGSGSLGMEMGWR